MQNPLGRYACLVADDEETVCQVLVEYLNELKMFKFIIPVTDGLDARQKIMNQKFDLLVLDINMPKLNGIKVVEFTVANKKIHPETILVISGYPDPKNIKILKDLGVKHFLVKPFDQEAFLDKIKSILKLPPSDHSPS